MADTKISALTAVTTPASTDEFAVNQGGTSKKMTRAQIHALQSGEVLAVDAGLVSAIPLHFGDSTVGLFKAATNRIGFGVGGTKIWDAGASYLRDGANVNGPQISWSNASSTNPTLVPSKADTNTGIGLQAADNLSLIAGGAEGVRVEDPADLAATETSLWVYDLDGTALKQVTVGANDSGGSGFKVLRIAN